LRVPGLKRGVGPAICKRRVKGGNDYRDQRPPEIDLKRDLGGGRKGCSYAYGRGEKHPLGKGKKKPSHEQEGPTNFRGRTSGAQESCRVLKFGNLSLREKDGLGGGRKSIERKGDS